MSTDEILAAIPHRPPFLLVDEIVERQASRIVCRKTWRPDEFFYQGHYPNYPLTPGVLLCESAMQAGAVLLSERFSLAIDRVPIVARMNDVRFKRPVLPGETVDIEVELTDQLAEAYYLRAKVTCDGKLAVRLEFTCMVVNSRDKPGEQV